MSHKGNTETFYREIISKLTEKMKDEYNNEGIGEDTLLLMKKVLYFHLTILYRNGKKSLFNKEFSFLNPVRLYLLIFNCRIT